MRNTIQHTAKPIAAIKADDAVVVRQFMDTNFTHICARTAEKQYNERNWEKWI